MPAPKPQYSQVNSNFILAQGDFGTRDLLFQLLRKAYENSFDARNGVGSSGINMIYNLIANSVDSYVDFLSYFPDINVPVPEDDSENTQFYDKIENYLYGVWQNNKYIQLQQWLAWYQSLLGLCGVMVVPQPDNKETPIRLRVLVPDYSYPVPEDDDAMKLKEFYYCYREKSTNITALPNQDEEVTKPSANTNVLEFYDKYWFVRYKDGKEVDSFFHDLGFVPAHFAQNRIRPHRIRGGSDVEHILGMNEYLNDIFSYMAEIMEETADSPLVISGAILKGNEITRGPGSTINIPTGGKAYRLPPTNAPGAMTNMMDRLIKVIQDHTGVGPIQAGNVKSGVSGKAIKPFLSGFEARVSSKAVSLGLLYETINSSILKLTEKIYPNEELRFSYSRKGTKKVNAIKGKDIDGYYYNSVSWPATPMDFGSRVSQQLQLMGAKIISRRTARENLGIESPDQEEAFIQKEQEAMQQRNVQPGMPQADKEILDRGGLPANITDNGQPPKPPAGTPDNSAALMEMLGIRPGSGKPGGAGKSAPAGPGAVRPVNPNQPFKAREGSAPTESAAPFTGKAERLTLDVVVKALTATPKLVGQVYLLGEIVVQGFADAIFDIGLTDLRDKATILNANPQFKGRIKFIKVTGEPKGEFVKIKGA